MLKAIDGFDHYNSATDMMARAGFLSHNVPTASNALSFVTGYDGVGKAARFTAANTARCLGIMFADRNAAAYVGCRLRLSHGAEFRLWDGFAASAQMSVLFDPADKSIAIYQGTSTLVYRTDPNVWSVNTWFMFELYLLVANVGGALKVRIDGVNKAGIVGIDTQQTGNAYWDVMRVYAQHGGVGNSTIDIDDFYYCDTAAGPGPYPMNTFIGKTRVVTLFPNGNDAVQFTPLSGTNYQMIDEQAMDSDSTYNYSSTYQNKDSFNFEALPVATASIFGVQLTTAARKDDSGLLQLQQFLKLEGEEFPVGSLWAMSGTYRYFSEVWPYDLYSDQAWTVSAINALSAGYQHATPPGYGMSYGTYYG